MTAISLAGRLLRPARQERRGRQRAHVRRRVRAVPVERVRPRRLDARRPAVGRRAPAGHADRRHAARADCSACRVGNEAIVAHSRWCAGGHRDRPRSAPRICSAPLDCPCPVLSVDPAAVRRLAIRNQRLAGPAPRGRPTRRRPARHRPRAALPAARPDGGRRPQSPARALQPPRRVRRDARSSELAYERARAVRVLGARGVATCSARTCRSTARRCSRRAAAPGAPSRTPGGTREARVPRAHPRAPDRGGPAARARHRGPRARSAGCHATPGRTGPTSTGCST